VKQELRSAYVARIATEISEVLTGARFEQFSYIIVDQYFGEYELHHRGTNLAGAPVGHVVDTFSKCGKVVCEYSTDANYFVNTTKIDKDTRHALEHYSGTLEKLLLLSNRLCNPKQQRAITEYITEVADTVNVDIRIWDARKLSEYIVDDLLLDEEVTERLSHFLPSIRTIRNESAINLTLPKVEESYQKRADLEEFISTKLLAGNSSVIVGFGGTGKSHFTVAIANSIKEQFDISLWLDASELEDINKLGLYDVFRNGHQLNLLGLLQSKKVLLVLDDLLAPVSQEQLEALCKNGSTILATRRKIADAGDWQLPLLDLNVARKILEFGIETPCPDALAQKVYDIVGGYPLIYGLMNANMHSDDYEWEDIDNDCKAIAEYEDEKSQKLTERLLGHLLGSLATQLSFIKACNTKVIDLNFAKASISPIGIKKLVKSTILTKSGLGFLKVHDVIFEALANIDTGQTDIASLLQNYLKHSEYESWSSFLRVSHRHNKLIYSLYRSTGNSIYLYSYLIASTPATLIRAEIQHPLEQFEAIKISLPTIDRIQISTLIESMENLYLLDKETSEDKAKEQLDQLLPIFVELINLVAGNIELLKLIRHHYAKCLLRLGQESQAEAEFITLTQEHPSMHEAKLQLARIYARTNRADETKALIEEILDAWDTECRPSISVALASFELVSRSSMKAFKSELNSKYADLVALIIKEAMAFGYEHSYRAFGVFSGDWAYNHPDKFLDVFNYLPLPHLSSIPDNYTKYSIGDLYREAGKICLRAGESKADTYLSLALELYESVPSPSPFQLRRIAETYCLKGICDTSESICLSILSKSEKDPFVYFWLSKSQIGLDKLPEALVNIDIGIEKLNSYPEGFKASFLEIKSDIHRSTDHDDYIKILNEAADITDSPKYKLQLEEKIQLLSNCQRSLV
jgi:DNA replication protein DnaC